MTIPELTRLSVNLNQESADYLQEYASDKGVSLTEAVRRVIGVSKFVHDEVDSGRKIVVVNKKGRPLKEVFFAR